MTSVTRSGRTSTPVSSATSRTAAVSTVSPASREPPGTLQRLRFGSEPRLTRRTSSPWNTIAPTAGTGERGYSFERRARVLSAKCGVSCAPDACPNGLREDDEVVERPLVQDMLQDGADPDVAGHRDVEARLQVLERISERRESPRRTPERLPHVLPDVPHPDGHDVPGVRLPQDDGRGLAALPEEGLADRESSGVVAAADARVRRPTLVPLVVSEHHDVSSERIPERVRIPGLDELVPPRPRKLDDQETIVEADRLVHPDLVEEGKRLDPLSKILADRVVDRRDGPAGRDEPPVFREAERADAERSLDLRDGHPICMESEDRVPCEEVRVRRRAVETQVDPQGPEVEPTQRGRRTEGLDVVVEDDAAVGLAREADFDLRRRGRERELPREGDDSPARLDVHDVGAVHAPHELGPEAHDVFHRPSEPGLRGVEDFRVAVDGRYERPDKHLRIGESADEDARRRCAFKIEPLD